jgi:hypothetical protein
MSLQMGRAGLLFAVAAWGLVGGTLHAQGGVDAPDQIAGMQAIRGDLVKVSGEVYTVRAAGGTLYRVYTGANTHFVAGEQETEAKAIHAGQYVLAGGDLDTKAGTLGAVFLAAVDRAQLAEFDQRRKEFGKTWLAGTVRSIHGTDVELKRTDDEISTVVVDENTSFRKAHESVTLADLKVGDGLTARGSLGKGGFAATVVTVVDGREIQNWAKLRDR